MTQNVDEKVLSKVKKLLALAADKKGKTDEESQTAMLKAQEFMAKHGVSMAQVGEVGGEATKKEVKHERAFNATKLDWWVGQLSVIIGKNFRCKPYISNGYKNKTIVFLGLKEDAELAAEVFKFAEEAIKYHARAYRKSQKKELIKETGLAEQSFEDLEYQVPQFIIDKYADTCGYRTPQYRSKLVAYIRENVMGQDAKAIRNDFIKGFLKGLHDKFKEQVERNNWGLILVMDALVVQAEKDMNLKAGKAHGPVRGGGMGSSEAFASGYEKGKNFQKPAGEMIEG